MLLSSQDSIFEDATWEALSFEYGDLSNTELIVARGQFGASYMLGRVRVGKRIPNRIQNKTMMKSCPRYDEENCFNGLKSELNILYDLYHTNLTNLYGYCTEDVDNVPHLVLVFEYCSNGNLNKVLQKGRPYFDKGKYNPKRAIDNEILSPGIFLNFCGWHLVKWATEIARGMEYLSFRGVVHCDLAARNVLLNCDWTAKICNFGISLRHNIQESFSAKLDKEVLPLAWMAPEVLQALKHSESSDVWSYGITLWEIYSLGDLPYRHDRGLTQITSKFYKKLFDGIRPTKPVHANTHLWDLMKSCWMYQPQARPTFSKIKTFLEKAALAAKSDWETTTTSHFSHEGHASTSESPQASHGNAGKKAVSFAPQVTKGGAIKKYFLAVDDILFKTTNTTRQYQSTNI